MKPFIASPRVTSPCTWGLMFLALRLTEDWRGGVTVYCGHHHHREGQSVPECSRVLQTGVIIRQGSPGGIQETTLRPGLCNVYFKLDEGYSSIPQLGKNSYTIICSSNVVDKIQGTSRLITGQPDVRIMISSSSGWWWGDGGVGCYQPDVLPGDCCRQGQFLT